MGERFSKCTTNTSNNGQRGGGVAGDGGGIRCLVAPEDALGRVRTPPAAVAALRSRLVHAGFVVDVVVRDDRGGRGGRGEGGWRHF